MKNNVTECLLLSSNEYMSLMDEANDAKLLIMANNRMSKANLASVISAEDVYTELGTTPEDLVDFDEVEIE